MLPITPFLPQIFDTLVKNNKLVLQAEPGAGKSTVLPLSLIDSAWLGKKRIVMLEPRKVAVKSIAHYLADQLGEAVGQRIGYQIKNEWKISDDTILEIVTEGILTRRLQSDPELNDVGLIILDEFHERSVHSDLALMLALEVQQSIREDLKILVMSATIDTQAMSRYLDQAPVISCPGRAYPVTVSYASQHSTFEKIPLSSKVMSALKAALSTNLQGDILVFLPGQADIQRCLNEAEKMYAAFDNVSFLPLYGGLPLAQQEQALRAGPAGKKRVIFSTNIAETSLTINGICCVIDSGLEKRLVYDPQSGMTRLETGFISKASAEQRKGRAGRQEAGTCIRLWTEQKQNSLQDFQEEEILNCDLAGLVLELHAWGLTEFQSVNWLTPPPQAHFESAKQLLLDLALISEQNTITANGKRAATLGIHPRLANMLLNANDKLEQTMACELAALLSETYLFQAQRSVDIIERMLALQEYKEDRQNTLKRWPIRRSTAEQILKSAKSLRNTLKLAAENCYYSLSDLQTHVSKLLLHAYPDRLAKKRAEKSGRYLLANGKGVQLFDDDPLFDADWLVVTDCNALKQEGQIFQAAEISLAAILQELEPSFYEKVEYRLDAKKLSIAGWKSTCYRAITLHTQPLGTIPQDAFQEYLHQLLRAEGLSILDWTKECDAWLARAAWLGSALDNFPGLTKQTLVESCETWLLPYLSHITSLSDLKQVAILPLLESCLDWEQQQLLEREAPEWYRTPSDKTISIRYDEHQGPTVSVRLQEMFGELESPRLACSKVPLRFELLSPAQRPIQTTSDLANFWQSSYHEVAKEMRGRYPKHRWPEQPLLEKPGHSVKHPRSK